jgi:hypothetical protein
MKNRIFKNLSSPDLAMTHRTRVLRIGATNTREPGSGSINELAGERFDAVITLCNTLF